MFSLSLPNIKSLNSKLYKSSFYQKSLPLKTDFSKYNKYFKLWHPRYFDVDRRTEYQKNVRDHKVLRFHSQDPLHFDYNMSHISGDFKLLLDSIKKDRTPTTTYSIYRVIYLMYHMAKNEIYDNEFFDELESQINPVIANSQFLLPRQIYGALYGYYKFSRGRPENVLFFETCLEEEPSVLHNEMSYELFELAHDSEFVDKDRLDLFILNFFKPNFLTNWDKEVRYKQRLIAEFHRIFTKTEYLDEEVWMKLIDMTVNAQRINNMDNYDKMLKGMIWYNDNPKSPMFKKVTKDIEKFKNRIRTNPNRFWKYDVERVKWRSYDELVASREEFDDSYVHAFNFNDVVKADKIVVKEKKEYTMDEVKKIIENKIKEKIPVNKIKYDLSGELKVDQAIVDEALVEIAKEKQSKAVEDLRRKGLFVPEMSSNDLKEYGKKMKPAPSATPKAGAAKGGKKK